MLFAVLLLAGCASHKYRATDDNVHKLLDEARGYETADVNAEVDTRIRSGDLRFKGWVKDLGATTVFLPGISESDVAKLKRLSLPDAEVLYIEGVFPFIDVAAYEKRTAALFEYMQRFNRALFTRLITDERISKSPNPESCVRPEQSGAVNTTLVEQARK